MMTFLKHRSIAYTIFLGIFAVTILSTLFITFTVYSAFSDVLRQNEIKYNLLATNTIKHNFDLTINLIQRTADSLTSNSNITDCLQKRDMPGGSQDSGELSEINRLLENILVMQPFIENIHILSSNGALCSSAPQPDTEKLYQTYRPYFESAMEQDAPEAFWIAQELSITYIRPIYRFHPKQAAGIIVININYEYVREMFMISAIQINERVVVTNQRGDILFNYPHFTAFEPFLEQHPELLRPEFTQLETKVFGVDRPCYLRNTACRPDVPRCQRNAFAVLPVLRLLGGPVYHQASKNPRQRMQAGAAGGPGRARGAQIKR